MGLYTVSQEYEWMNWTDFLHAHTSVRKAKSYFGYIGSKESYFKNLFEENKKKQNLAGNKSVKAYPYIKANRY